MRFVVGKNRAPYVANPIPNQARRLENGALELSLSSVFEDREASDLSIKASSSNAEVAAVEKTGEVLTVTPKTDGDTRVTLTATDGGGKSARESFTVEVIGTPLPSPQIVSRTDPPLEVGPGQEFSLSMEVSNEGGAATYGSISISLPDYDSSEDRYRVKSIGSTSSGDEPGYIERAKGDPIFSSSDEQINAEYLLAEYADENWKGGETNRLELEVTAPSTTGTLDVYIRATLSSGQTNATLPASDSDANTTTDQQGFRTYHFRVDVTKNPIPVELAQFKSNRDAQDVVLRWQTASEKNNAGFGIQRKTETEQGWDKIGFVESSAEGGTTDEPQSYRFEDEDLPYEADTLQYRLKQTDLDGSVHHSDPIAVERKAPESLEFLGTYPNPARSQAVVRYALPRKKSVRIGLYDVLGRQVRAVADEKREGRHESILDLSGLSSGVYFLRLRYGGKIQIRKLTVVR